MVFSKQTCILEVVIKVKVKFGIFNQTKMAELSEVSKKRLKSATTGNGTGVFGHLEGRCPCYYRDSLFCTGLPAQQNKVLLVLK